jgi:PD-(D/E)XK nuclease superfamily
VILVPWTYTLLNTLDTCQHRAFRQYILKDTPYAETDAIREGNRVHKALEERINKGISLPEDLRAQCDAFCLMLDGIGDAKGVLPGLTVQAEVRMGMLENGTGCDFFDRNVWGRGKADLIVRNDTTAMLYDWKTGKVREDPFELELQALLLKANHPSLQIIKGRFMWLRRAEVAGTAYDLSDTLRTAQKVRHALGIIEDCRAMGMWIKSPGPLCGWCNVSDCEHRLDGARP